MLTLRQKGRKEQTKIKRIPELKRRETELL